MADLKTLKTPHSPNDLVKVVNDNFTELDFRKADITDLEDLVSDSALESALESITDSISDIVDGTTIPAKARTLEPSTHPGNLKYFGTSEAGTLGYHDMHMPEGARPITTESFTDTDSRWSGAVDGVYTLSFAHDERYPLIALKQINAGEFVTVSVDIVRDSTNVRIKATEKFEGYIVLG